MSLTTQEKLALMMTSAGSQRNLAALVGVSHQRIGRWLAGPNVDPDTGAITNEPRDPAILDAINQAFSIHRDVARQQSRIDRLPFNPALPVFMERMPFSDGRPGERVIAKHTQYITPFTRERVMIDAGQSKAFINVSLRSIVDLRKYNDRANAFAASDKARGVFRTQKQDEWRGAIRMALSDGIVQRPMYTQKEDFFRFVLTKGEVAQVRSIKGEVVAGRLDAKLRNKHEPATGSKGTTVADEYLFQTFPLETLPQHAKSKTRRRVKRR